jgi:hypothetical protein
VNPRQLSRLCTLDAVASPENLMLAAWKARRGKSRRPDVEDWWLGRERNVLRLREALLAGSYQPGGYRFFEIREPKRRLIAAAPFEDRVVHHALCHLLAGSAAGLRPLAPGGPAEAAAAEDLPRVARRFVEQQRHEPAVGVSPPPHARQSHRRCGFSVCVGGGFLSEGGTFRRDAGRALPAGPEPRVQPNRCPRARGLTGRDAAAGRGR